MLWRLAGSWVWGVPSTSLISAATPLCAFSTPLPRFFQSAGLPCRPPFSSSLQVFGERVGGRPPEKLWVLGTRDSQLLSGKKQGGCSQAAPFGFILHPSLQPSPAPDGGRMGIHLASVFQLGPTEPTVCVRL